MTNRPTQTETPNSLEVLGAAVEESDINQLMTLIGEQRAFGLMASMTSHAWAVTARKIKNGKGYKQLGLDWESFCPRFLGVSRQRVDAAIKNLEEFGDTYFALSDIVRVSPNTYRAIEGAITEQGEIEFGGEVVKIDKANAPKVRQVVEHFRKEVERERQRAADARHDAKEAREQRDEARKAEKREKERFEDELRRQSGLYPHLTQNQKELRLACALVTSLCIKLRAVKNSESLTEAERSELKGHWGLFLDQICDATGIFLDPMQMELLEDAKTLLAQEG